MVVKIPVLVNRAKAAVSNEIIETPGTNTTEITPEKKNEIAAVAAEKKAATATNNITYHELIQRHFPRHQSKSNANDDSNVGDNSSISSRSSMNSMPNTLDRGEANPTTYVAALKAAAAASTRPSSEDAATVSSPSDHSREHIDHPYASPESLQLNDEPQPHQNLNTSRSLSFILPPRPSSPDNSLDWQFSGNMDNFFEENDRTAGLSAEHEAENENTDACPLERCQLESFDSAERKLLLRESSNAGGSGTSSSTHKITNRSSDRIPMPSPNGQVPPSIGDIFSPGTKGSAPPIMLPKRKSNMFGPPCEPSPSGLFLNIPATNSFSDLLTTSNDNEDRPETVESTADQDTKASGDNKEMEPKKKESDESDKPQYNDIMNTLKDAEEIELKPPAPLGSDHVEGHRRFIIDGAMKTCTNYGIDQISSNETDGSFYHFLQALSPAFEGCTFLLPWLRQSETKVKVNVSLLGGFKLSQGTLIRPMQAGPSPKDLANAKRRIQSTICAFGGSINSKKENEDDAVEKFVTFTKDTSKSSIFRSRSCSPSSTSSSKSAGQKRKRQIKSIMRREKYEETLRDQYFENGDRLSWDVQHSLKLSLSGAKTFDEEDNSDTSSSKQDDAEADIVASADIEIEKRPIRYKCTLCGALKKKHVCANRPTILRSIGVNVYPAVNAYTADEPGELATPLSQMNNFIPLSSRNSCQLTTDEEIKKMKATPSAQIQVTSITPNESAVNLMFRPTMEITSYQYLDVKAEPTARDYLYPDVPLTSGQRKSMSDALLSMSRSVPQLTNACAMVLKDARKGDKWDQAVAELMAQVLCILKCSLSKDYSLDGLKRYLLELGVSC